MLVSAAGTLRRFAAAGQKENWLPGIADGSLLVTAATEEYNNDNPANPNCRAEAVEGGYALSGTKTCVPAASQSRRILVPATTGEELVVALVDPAAAGVSLSPQVVTSGEIRHELHLDKVQVPDAEVVATGGKALDWFGFSVAVSGNDALVGVLRSAVG